MAIPGEEHVPGPAQPEPDLPGEPVAATPLGPPASPPGRDRPGGRSTSPLDLAAATCSYLVSAHGSWRGIKPSSDHRCAAETPAGLPSREHQRSLCLSERFAACPVYAARRAAAGAGPGSDPGDADRPVAVAGGRWSLRPTAPIVVVGPPSALDPRVLVRSRRVAAVALVVLMIAAFALVALARLPGLVPGGEAGTTTQPGNTPTAATTAGAPGAAASPASAAPRGSDESTAAPPTPAPPSPTGSVEAATATPAAATPAAAAPSAPTQAPAPVATSTPSDATTPVPSPTVARTYVVQRGDTLSSIARRFDTTIEAIAAANGITNPSLIRVGQVLVIP